MKKILSFLMVFAFLTTQSMAATAQGLEAAYNELDVALSVDWDQRDQAFKDAQTDKFMSNVQALRAAGVTNQELLGFAVSKVKDATVRQQLETTYSLVSIGRMSEAQATSELRTILEKGQASGASWSSDAVVGGLVIIAVVAVFLVLIGQNKVEDGCYQVYRCDTDCSFGVCTESCGYECI